MGDMLAPREPHHHHPEAPITLPLAPRSTARCRQYDEDSETLFLVPLRDPRARIRVQDALRPHRRGLFSLYLIT
ncbi:unnamed protein product [Gadus morhua 'NCC']